MNIILHNYIKKIEDLFKIYFSNKIDSIVDQFTHSNPMNYFNLMSSFDLTMNSFLCQTLIILLEELDFHYSNSLERKSKYHIKSHHSRTILTIFGQITFSRTFFSSKLDGSLFCYVDRLLGLKKYDYFDPYIKAEVLDFVSENNYSATAKHVNSLIASRVSLEDKTCFLSRQTVRNIILTSNIAIPKTKKLRDTEALYIIADEKWIPTQNNNHKKVMQKSIVIFDGFHQFGKRKSLNNKMTFSGRNEDFIYEAIDYIENAYDVSNIKYFYMLGDGASWIKNLKYYFNYNENVQIIQALDKFHFKQAIWRIYNDKEVYHVLSNYIIRNNKDDFTRLLNEIIDLNPERKDKIEEYKTYILNNLSNIQNLYKYSLSCPMESQISHTFASYFTSRPKGYSKDMIDRLIKLRLLKKNKHNIKQLYIKNLNSSETINFNEQKRNYSMFDKKETYTVLSKKANFKAS